MGVHRSRGAKFIIAGKMTEEVVENTCVQKAQSLKMLVIVFWQIVTQSVRIFTQNISILTKCWKKNPGRAVLSLLPNRTPISLYGQSYINSKLVFVAHRLVCTSRLKIDTEIRIESTI